MWALPENQGSVHIMRRDARTRGVDVGRIRNLGLKNMAESALEWDTGERGVGETLERRWPG